MSEESGNGWAVEPAADLGLRQTIAADLRAVAAIKGTGRLTPAAAIDALALPGSCAVLLFRLAAACRRAGLRPLGRILYFLNVVLFGAALHPAAQVGPGLVMAHPVGTGWGQFFVCGRNLTLASGVRFGNSGSGRADRQGHPTLGNDVIMFDGSKALGPVRIGDRAIVAANALVLSDVPADAIVVGQPARVTRLRTDTRPEDQEADGVAVTVAE